MTQSAPRAHTAELPLDRWQQNVCDLPAGSSAMIVGAPGTGKTSTLLHYARTLVERDQLRPDELLVFAPNRQAATALRDPLALALGRTTDGPIVRSVPSVAFELVAEGLGEPPVLLTGAEHDQLIADLLAGEIADGTDQYWPSHLGRELRGLRSFRAELRELMMRAAERGISTELIADLGRRYAFGNWLAAARFIEQYQHAKLAERSSQFDVAELVGYAARLVEEAEQLALRDRLRVVLIDDVQEVTASTRSLLQAFAARGIALVGFGNPDVASSGFRGGRADLVGGFGQLFPEPLRERLVRLPPLGRSYRLGTALGGPYDQVVAAIGTAGEARQREPRRSAETPGRLRRASAPSAHTQARLIADDLREQHLLHQVPWVEMVVLTRSAAAARDIEAQLGRLGVPTRRSLSQLLLRSEPGASWLLRAMQLAYADDPFGVASSEHAAVAAELLCGPLGQLDPVGVRRLRLELRRAAVAAQPEQPESADELLCSAFVHPVEFDQLGTRVANTAARVARAIHEARVVATGGSVEEVLWSLWTASGIERHWLRAVHEGGALAEEANRNLDAVVALQSAARRFVEQRPTEPGVTFVDELLATELPEDSLARERNQHTVLVTTPPAVIGRQFRHVVIAGLQDGVWPNLRPRNTLLETDRLIELAETGEFDDVLDLRAQVRSDELRLFALAYSRASESVLLTAVASDDELPSMLWSVAESEPERFVPKPLTARSLVAELRRSLNTALAERPLPGRYRAEDAAAGLAALATAGVVEANPSNWYGLREPSTEERILPAPAVISPSSLEKLRKSSLNWFIDRYAPESSGNARAIGDLVHAAMETADPTTPDLATMERQVDERWTELHFDAEWQQIGRRRAVSRMLQRVCEYLEQASAAGRVAVAVEAAFDFMLDDAVRVKGRIDRVEQRPDGTVFVVDLKTGRLSGIDGPRVVERNLQLQVYQLAIAEAEVEGVPAGESAGAALLAVDTDTIGGELRQQSVLSEQGLDDIRAAIDEAAALQLNSTFWAVPETEYGYANGRRYRIHMVMGVSE